MGITIVRVRLDKNVDGWSNVHGAHGHPRHIFDKCDVLFGVQDVEGVVKAWLHDKHWLDLDQFEQHPENKNILEHSRLEDKEGMPDESATGKYLADYALCIDVYDANAVAFVPTTKKPDE